MAAGDAYNFPVVREAIGHEDALYGFKGGFDRAGLTLGLKAGGYWPNNLEKRDLINHQSTVFLFDPDTGKARAMVGGNLLTALRTAAASSSISIKASRSSSRVSWRAWRAASSGCMPSWISRGGRRRVPAGSPAATRVARDVDAGCRRPLVPPRTHS